MQYEKQNHSQRNPQRGLRYVERYVQDIVAAQPFPPRHSVKWTVLLRSLAPQTGIVFLALFGLFLVLEFAYRNQAYASRPFNYYLSITLGSIGLLGALYTDILQQMYRWWSAIRHGRYTVARIVDMQQRRLHYANALDGHWQFGIEDTTCTSPFRIDDFWSGKWIWRLNAGSEVHILVHPTKPIVLVAIGIVDEASPRLTPPAEPAFLAELLASRPSDDST